MDVLEGYRSGELFALFKNAKVRGELKGTAYAALEMVFSCTAGHINCEEGIVLMKC